MMSLEQQVIPPAYDGIDADSAPDLVPLTRAPIVENLLVDSPGKLPLRGPLSTRSAQLATYPTNLPIGFWQSTAGYEGNAVLVSYKNGTAGLDPWQVPFVRWSTDSSGSDLATGSTTATLVDLRNGVTSALTITRDTVPGPRSASVGQGVYGPAFDSASAVYQSGSYIRPRKLLRWDGVATLTAVTGAPDSSADVAAHLNRLWLLGGRDIPSGVGSPPLELNTLYYSVNGGPEAADASTGLTAFSASSWKDFDATTQNRPRTNKIVVGSNDNGNDVGVGLAKVGQNLVVLKRQSIYMLSGYDPSNFTVKQFSGSHGCVDARSIVQWDDGVFFASELGFMFFDGAKLTNTTASLRSSVVASILKVRDQTNGYVIAVRLPNDYIALSVGIMPDQILFSGLYHTARRAWCTFSSRALANGAPIGFGRGKSIPFLVTGGRLIRCDHITSPLTAPAGTYGVDSLGDDFTWTSDPSRTTFSGTGGTLRNTETGIEMFPPTSGTQWAVKGRWRSRLFPLSTPFLAAQVHRVLLDYVAKFLGGTDDTPSWTVSVTDGAGRPLADPYDVPGQGDASAYPIRRRNVKDNFAETTDLQIDVTWDQPAAPLQEAAILSSAVEFQPTHQRRSE